MSADRKKMTKSHWRSLDDLAGRPEYRARVAAEFPAAFAEAELDGVSRRQFLSVMGASFAMAGLAGCVRKPVEKIVPFARRPEDYIPGKPRFFATGVAVAGRVEGLLVESQDGRPTKVEGNPDHPANRGRASAFAQAMVLDLYDPDRSQQPYREGEPATWDAFDQAAASEFAALRERGGEGLAVVVDAAPSPTRERLLAELAESLPKAEVFVSDLAGLGAETRALELAGLADHRLLFDLEKARVIASFDSDFLVSEGDVVRNARSFAAGRSVSEPADAETMNRLYAVSSTLTPTSVAADHRLALATSRTPGAVLALAIALEEAGLGLPEGAVAAVKSKAKAYDVGPYETWVGALAEDILAHRGAGLILVGARQPDWVHALALLLNAYLGNVGSTLHPVPAWVSKRPTMKDFAAKADSFKAALFLGVNPVYSEPRDLDLAQKIAALPLSIHLGSHLDETGQQCTWHVPQTHPFEAWGDVRASDGTASVQQPIIAPLYGGRADIEVLGALVRGGRPSSYDLVRETWAAYGGGDFERQWRRWLHDGVIGGTTMDPVAVSFEWQDLVAHLESVEIPPATAGLEIEFVLDQKVFDGRFANNAWLQELPDPLTKLTWDNAALMSEATAKSLGLVAGRDYATAAARGYEAAAVIELSGPGASVEIPVFVTPGTVEGTIVLPLGYGRAVGAVAKGAGVDVGPLRRSDAPWVVSGATAKVTGRSYKLATTQDHGWMEGRPIVREATVAEYQKNPHFVEEGEVMEPSEIKSLWKEPNPKDGNQWGMAVDLTRCTGCNACVVACGAENNVMVVGKERVLTGREMHWIRIDRYYTGDPENPQAVMQPVMCAHCELAPCENVCPVGATLHSPEGLNDMAYNRCIGTRYCSDNCPYKVRRFNFFNYSRENDEAAPIQRLQRNPDVTIRFRGVMEKCSYCVQRIQEAKIKAKRSGRDLVGEGEVITACQQTCPTSAIVFGDINDPESAVSTMKRQSRNYVMLAELNIYPRTSYLAKLRNANEKLG